MPAGARRWLGVALAAALVAAAPAGARQAGAAPATAAPITRAAFAVLLARSGRAPAGTVGPPFADVPPAAPWAAAVEAVTGLGWMSAAAPGRFAPDAPLTRLTAAEVAADYLGLVHVAADEDPLPLPYADAAAIPAADRGAVAVATHLGLEPPVGPDFAPALPLTVAQAEAFLRRLTAVTVPQIQLEGARVAAYVHVIPAAGAVEVGGRLAFTAYAHDAAGYVIPARFTWASSTRTLTPAPGGLTEGQAVLAAPAAGWITVRARVIGSAVAASTAVLAQAAAALAVGPLPPAVLRSQPLPVPVHALTAAGATDQGAGFPVQLALWPAGARGRPARVLRARLDAGEATLQLPPLPAGRYRLRVTAGGGAHLPPWSGTLLSVPAPVGSLALRPRGGSARWVAGSTGTVDGAVYANLPVLAGTGAGDAELWPLQVTVSGTEPQPPPLPGESPPPPTLLLDVASATLPATGGAVAVVAAANPGSGRVQVGVPGGALRPAALAVTVLPAGRFRDPRVTPAAATAGHAVTLRVRLAAAEGGPGSPAAAGAVDLEPIDPAGHPRAYVAATVSDGVATASFTPTLAGTWRFRWRAPGFLPARGGQLPVAPGRPVRLVVDATPTSVLLPGQRVAIQAWLADRFGNAVPAPFRLALERPPDAPGTAGRLAFAPGAFPGPGVVGSFTGTPRPLPGAGSTETLTFRSPGQPALGPARLTLRVVRAPADRVAGKGLWLLYPDWKAAPDATLLRQAAAEGITHLYLEVATTRDGFYGAPALDDLLPKAHALGIALVAWVYAGLEDPAADEDLLRQVVAYVTPHGDRADGVALDVEEVLTPAVVAAYARLAAAREGPSGLVVGVVDPPQFVGSYPYAAMAPYVQAFAPMDYWHVREADYPYAAVYRWVADSVAILRQRAHRPTAPVEVILETFDWFSPAGQGIFSPTAGELAAALRAAHDAGAIGVSFYRQATATAGELAVMRAVPWPPPWPPGSTGSAAARGAGDRAPA